MQSKKYKTETKITLKVDFNIQVEGKFPIQLIQCLTVIMFDLKILNSNQTNLLMTKQESRFK